MVSDKLANVLDSNSENYVYVKSVTTDTSGNATTFSNITLDDTHPYYEVGHSLLDNDCLDTLIDNAR